MCQTGAGGTLGGSSERARPLLEDMKHRETQASMRPRDWEATSPAGPVCAKAWGVARPGQGPLTWTGQRVAFAVPAAESGLATLGCVPAQGPGAPSVALSRGGRAPEPATHCSPGICPGVPGACHP